ncbi:DUF6326 family protein [Phycicoccus sp. Soil748]|uniref:DUF6326 family protein n=1 Tax=Intrasporangiaceae TaxID=85021 RepID=UPI000AFB3A56|nr:DUF6326 family protein [Phycicoccus sp. Soil748]
MTARNHYQDPWISPRTKISALWTSMLFVFAYVDLFSSFRADVRADIAAGKMFAFTIGQGFLLGVTIYVLVPSLMVFLSLVLPVRATRMANLVAAVLYAVTIAGGAIGEWSYYIVGSLAEVALLGGVVYYAWTWSKTTDAVGSPAEQSRDGVRVHSAPHVRG